MEQPTDKARPEIPQLPEPLAASAPPLEPLSPTQGCGKPVWVGCGCLLLLVAGVSVMFLLKADDFVAWWLGQAEQLVVEGLPAEVDAETRARLAHSFDDFAAAIADGRGNATAIARMQRELGSAVSKAGSGDLSRDDVLRLIDALDRASGASPENPPPIPAPVPGPAGEIHA